MFIQNKNLDIKCRISRPIEQEIDWTSINKIASRSSRIGPNQLSRRESKVKFVQIMLGLSTEGLLRTLPRPKRENRVTKSFPRGFSRRKSTITNVEASNWLVWGLSRGSRWRGHGTSPNNWGRDMVKLNIWGMNSNKRVLLKWPRIPETAKVIPAK